MRTRRFPLIASTVAAGILAATTLAGCTATSSTATVPVTISGGFSTKAVDNGRPVILVAAALGVPEDVFRTAFSGVTPAAAGEAPQDAQVLLNKQALLEVLAPYGITNDQLDAASNYYRYSGSLGQTWPHTSATAVEVMKNGSVVGFTITDAGSGYTSEPTITLPDGRTATATISYGTNLKTNGSISAITING